MPATCEVHTVYVGENKKRVPSRLKHIMTNIVYCLSAGKHCRCIRFTLSIARKREYVTIKNATYFIGHGLIRPIGSIRVLDGGDIRFRYFVGPNDEREMSQGSIKSTTDTKMARGKAASDQG